MRLMATHAKTILMSAGIFALAACATVPQVKTKVAKGVHLEQYKTYDLHAGALYGSGSEKPADPEVVGHLLETAVRAELERRGLKRSENNPDLIFSYVVARRIRQMDEEAHPYQEGGADLVAKDASGRIVWTSHLQGAIDPHDKTHRQLKSAIARAFKNYPSVSQ
jgi:hypothetical protein